MRSWMPLTGNFRCILLRKCEGFIQLRYRLVTGSVLRNTFFRKELKEVYTNKCCIQIWRP